MCVCFEVARLFCFSHGKIPDSVTPIRESRTSYRIGNVKLQKIHSCIHMAIFRCMIMEYDEVNYLKELLLKRDQEITSLNITIIKLKTQLEGQGTLRDTVNTATNTVPHFQKADDVELLKTVLTTNIDGSNEFDEQFAEWKQLFVNQYNIYCLNNKNANQYWHTRELMTHFMLGWFLRMQNDKKMPLTTVKLSFFLHYYGCTKPIWKLLSKLKLVLSYSKTRELLSACSKIDISHQLSWTTDKTIGVIGADNCAYYNNHHFERDMQEVKFINTVNWYHRYLDKPLKSVFLVEDNILQEFEPDVAIEFWYV